MKFTVSILTIGRDTAYKVLESAKEADEIIFWKEYSDMKLTQKSKHILDMWKGDVFIGLNDRTYLLPDWRNKLTQALGKINNHGVVSFNLGIPTTMAITRSYLEGELGNMNWVESYYHYWVDFEIGERANRDRKYVEIGDIVKVLPYPTPDTILKEKLKDAKHDDLVYCKRRDLGFPNKII